MAKAQSALDLFLEIPEVEGESKSKGHEKQMELISWGFAANNAVSQGGQGSAGKVSMSDIQITKNVCKGSPKLFLACCGGTRYPKVTIWGQRATGADGGQKPFYKVELENVAISIVKNDYVDPEGNETPPGIVETILFNPERMKVNYAPQKTDGSIDAFITTGFDFGLNAKI